jgi:hypothetical protein
MNFTESFDQFASKLTTTDLALYAGVGVVLYVLFKDRMSPVQSFLASLATKIKSLLAKKTNNIVHTTVPIVSNNTDNFYALVASWKTTRDLAVKAGCDEAVKVIDQAFPFLSPKTCSKDVQP